MTVAVDTNILIYAYDPLDPEKHERARSLMIALFSQNTIISHQVLGEYLAVTHRKHPPALPLAREMTGRIVRQLLTPSTEIGDLIGGSQLAERYGLSYFDALIAFIALRAGSRILLSEDFQDGIRLDGLTVIDPFLPKNEPAIARIMAGK